MIDMQLRIAKIVADNSDYCDSECTSCLALPECECMKAAKAIIAAMREPTEAMIDAGVDARRRLYAEMEAAGESTRTMLVADHPAGTIWCAMIDAALGEKP